MNKEQKFRAECKAKAVTDYIKTLESFTKDKASKEIEAIVPELVELSFRLMEIRQLLGASVEYTNELEARVKKLEGGD